LTTLGAIFLNYTTLSFCTIVMHIMLGTCVPSLRGRVAILVEFLVISLFHETKIPTVDMKVQVSFNFRKKNMKKNKISKLHED
jgi:hypothetical protein